MELPTNKGDICHESEMEVNPFWMGETIQRAVVSKKVGWAERLMFTVISPRETSRMATTMMTFFRRLNSVLNTV